MSMNNKGLGRGLDALFNSNSAPMPAAPSDGVSPLIHVAVDALEPNPWQPRENFDEESLRELADSITSQGLLQPLLVRPGERDGFYQIVAGERRWRAARLAGLTEVPAVCRHLDDNEVRISAMIENVQRDNLNPVEEARGLLAIKEALNLTMEELAAKVGKSRSAVSYSLRILKLDPETQAAIMEGTLAPTHARSLLNLENPEAVATLREHIIAEDMTSRDSAAAVETWQNEGVFPWDKDKSDQPAAADPKPEFQEKLQRDPLISELAKKIGALLQCNARINGTETKGSISLKYESTEQLAELLEKLGLTMDSIR